MVEGERENTGLWEVQWKEQGIGYGEEKSRKTQEEVHLTWWKRKGFRS